MAYCTANDVLDAMAAALGAASRSDIPSHFTSLATRAASSAYMMIRSRLEGRKFTPAQIDAWEFRAEWNINLAVYHAFRNAKLAGKDYGNEVELMKVWEDDLKTVVIVQESPVAGDVTPAQRVTTGQVASTDTSDPGRESITMDTTL